MDIPKPFDRNLYVARQKKASKNLSVLYAAVEVELAERLGTILRQFDAVALIGPPYFEGAIRASGKVNSLEVIETGPEDALALKPDSLNAVFSVLDLQTVNDVPGYFAQISAALKPDGLMMLCFFAGETLYELRESWLAAEIEVWRGTSPRIGPMIALRELGGLLQRAGLSLPVADIDRKTLRYASALALMQELRAMGFSNPLADRSRYFTSRRLLMAVAETYQARFADPDNRIRATVEMAWANAWKPHPSQPQPLRPGSAKARLADALKVPEQQFR